MLLGILNSQAAGGGGGSYELLSTYTVPSTSNSTISLTNIDQGYKHLQLRIANSNSSGAGTAMAVRFNSVSSSQYNNHHFQVYNGTMGTSWQGGQSALFYINSGFAASSACVIDILNYSSAINNTTTRSLSFQNSTNDKALWMHSGLWENTSAVSSIQLIPSFGSAGTGTRISIYGLKG
jgi:hypothetical protein